MVEEDLSTKTQAELIVMLKAITDELLRRLTEQGDLHE